MSISETLNNWRIVLFNIFFNTTQASEDLVESKNDDQVDDEKTCSCKDVHSRNCQDFKKFEMEDLNDVQKFRLWSFELSGDSVKYQHVLENYKKVIEEGKNAVSSTRYIRLPFKGYSSEYAVQEFHLVPQSEKIRSELSLLENKYERALRIEKMFELLKTLQKGDVIVSESGAERIVQDVSGDVISTLRDEHEEKISLREDLVKRSLCWVKEIRR